LKAVTMGVVASIEFFWSNMANPAIGPQRHEEDYLRQFEDHISNNLARISVDYMATWVNDTLLSDLPVKVSDRHGLYRPIRRKTVHD
jgi:hypothetical protein